MTIDDLITIQQAAKLSGRGKKTVLALIERGALPAVRRDGQWMIARADLVFMFPLAETRAPEPAATATPRQPSPAEPSATVPPQPESSVQSAPSRESPPPPEQRGDVAMLLEMLRQRDEQVNRLQEERAQLTGQIGFLQGLLVEREARLRGLEAWPAARIAAPDDHPAAPAEPAATARPPARETAAEFAPPVPSSAPIPRRGAPPAHRS